MAFDPKLFQKTKHYEPYVTNEAYIKSINDDSVSLIFDNEQTYSMSLSSIMKLIIKNKVSIINNSFVFPFILDSYGNPKPKHVYDSWLKETYNNTSISIDFNDLVIGNVYMLDDKKSYFIYLGLKYIISYRRSKAGEIIVSKVQKKHVAFEVYKHNDYKVDSIYENNVFYLNNKVKVIKDLKITKKDIVDTINSVFIIKKNILYYEDIKPISENYSLSFQEMTIEEILDITKTTVFSFDCFHKLRSGYFMSNNIFITDNFKNDREFSRQFSHTFVYDSEFNFKEEIYTSGRNYMDTGHLLVNTERCVKNDNFRLTPDNYYKVVINFN